MTITTTGAKTVQFMHTTELRYLMKENNGTTLQYRNTIIENGFPKWDEWKDVPVHVESLQQKESK